MLLLLLAKEALALMFVDVGCFPPADSAATAAAAATATEGVEDDDELCTLQGSPVPPENGFKKDTLGRDENSAEAAAAAAAAAATA